MRSLTNSNYDEGYPRYLKSSPNSDDFAEVGSGEEFKLRHVLAPFKLVFRNSRTWPGGVLCQGEVCNGEGITCHIVPTWTRPVEKQSTHATPSRVS